ncbi:Molybdopterin molybdenumtransferase 2 [Frondihabitans sp. 762G35]|uniref:molybdopterin molybdotransferase MoeA n=1 Tax=Frondihabitans sp. 762G35 TaxID=1446794 RepID=UPI000D20AE99|nr:molybdopterin molybdotransferase MoeA [Frondihabitans sp. 762G35]ARC56186.1 Molybdopterin molybdenumtransferase 2 [Frondihabitans sp. 762G35]
MRTIEEHAAAIDALVTTALAGRAPEVLPVDASAMARSPERYRDRLLLADVLAPLDLPPFDNSQMDGYAVDSSELAASSAAGSAVLAVGTRIPAGTLPADLGPGTAAPIMTGAPIPRGADAVIPIEQADPPRFLGESAGQTVVLPAAVDSGAFVRTVGSDVRAGDLLLPAGTVLRAAHFGILAASGVGEVGVAARPRVLVVSTGSELADGGELVPGSIHDANAIMLASLLTSAGATVDLARAPDDAAHLLDVLREHGLGVSGRAPGASGGAPSASGDAPAPDLVVTTGGVSAGAYEVVRETFAPRGVEFGSVAMQPGGPQGWGELDLDGGRRVAVVCFPGNPVSALVSFEAFLRGPLLRASCGRSPRRDATATLAEGADSPAGKHQVRRGRLDDSGLVHFVGGASSHLLHAYARSTVLVGIPVGTSRVEPGDEVVVWPLDD